VQVERAAVPTNYELLGVVEVGQLHCCW
jgi:hypothetical protein